MNPEDVLEELRARRPGLAALARRQGDPLDLAATLLPEVPEDEARAALVGAAPAAATAADVDGAPADLRRHRFAYAVALADGLDALPQPEAARDALDDLHHDLLGRPGAYRDLSTYALALSTVREHTGQFGETLLQLCGRAALDAPAEETTDMAHRLVLAVRRKARLRKWRTWLDELTVPAVEAVRSAVDALALGNAPLLASDGAPEALARLRLGDLAEGEVTLAVLPTGMLLEWDGEGPAPDALWLGDTALAPSSDASMAAASWELVMPPHGRIEVHAERGGARQTLQWPPRP